MTPELWQRVCAVLTVMEPLSGEERAAELDRLRSSDPPVAAEVESLLADQDTAKTLDQDSAIDNILGKMLAADDPAAAPITPADPDATPPGVPGCILPGSEKNVRFGGMGVVYFGTETALGRRVAVKVLRLRFKHDTEMLTRFEAEARINAQLQHPGVVPVHQIGKLADGRPFYTMKQVQGETFAEVLKRRTSPSSDLLGVLGQFRRVCEAMSYAHAHDVLHRDLKPGNVMVGNYGEVLLMDWGLAKVLGDGSTSDPTPEPVSRRIDPGPEWANRELTQGALGTVPYMPPEQAAGHVDQVDKRSDVFGLGAILCTILTGDPPYVGAMIVSLERKAIRAELEEAYLRLDECGADAELVALTRKCLSPKRENRPSDAGEVAKAIAAYLAGVEERRRRAEIERARAEGEARMQKQRRRAQLAFAIAVGLLLVGGLWFAWLEDRRETKKREEAAEGAREERDRLGRNTAALTSLVGTCEEALRAGEADRAEAALEEADRRWKEGGGEALADRISRCRAGLAVLTALDAIDTFRWTPADSRLPNNKMVAEKCKAAFERFGIVQGAVSVEESSRRVAESLPRNRLLGTLNLWFAVEPNADLRAVLSAVDREEYREGIRVALLAGKKADVVEQAGRVEALNQPDWFAAVLGQIKAVPAYRRRQILEKALCNSYGNLTLLMSLASTYPIDQRERAEERARWLQAALAAHPRNIAAHNNLGIALYDKGDLDGAIQEYQAAIALDPKYALPHNNLGLTLAEKGDLDGAIREYQAAIKLDPKFAFPHHNWGNALAANGDREGAIREYQAAIALDPKYASPHNGLGNVLADKGDTEEAMREFQAAIAIDANYALPHNNLGLALNAKNDLDGAIREYETAIALDPEFAKPHSNLGLALRAKGDLDGAIREYQAAIKLDPKFAKPHSNLGSVLADRGDREGAIREFKAAIALDPKFAFPHNNLGNALADKGDREGAMREYRIAIALDPKYALPHNGLGNALKAKDDLEGAIREFQTAIALDAKDAYPHNNLGTSLAAKGDREGAIREYKTAIALDPNFAFPHNNLGVALKGKGDLDGALSAFEEAVRLKSRWAPTYNELAELLSERGKSFTALQVLRDGLKVEPRFIEAFRYNLACMACLVANGKAKDAPPDVDRSALRAEALSWLIDDLKVQKKLSANPKIKPNVYKTMLHWLEDTDLVSVRDIDKLPANEQQNWAKLWADTRQLRDETAPPTVAPPPRLVR